MGFALRIESVPAMRAIAKRFVFGHAAAAKRDDGSTCQSVGIAFRILNAEFAFNANGPVIDDSDFRGHAHPMLAIPAEKGRFRPARFTSKRVAYL